MRLSLPRGVGARVREANRFPAAAQSSAAPADGRDANADPSSTSPSSSEQQRRRRGGQRQQRRQRRRPPSPPRRPPPAQAAAKAALPPAAPPSGLAKEEEEAARISPFPCPSTSSPSLRGSIVDFRRPAGPKQQQRRHHSPSSQHSGGGSNWLDDEIARLALVVSELRAKSSSSSSSAPEEVLDHLLSSDARVAAFRGTEAGRSLEAVVSSLPAEDAALLWTLPATGQEHVLASALLPDDEEESEEEEEAVGEGQRRRRGSSAGDSLSSSSSSSSSSFDVPSFERVSLRLTRLANGTLRPVERFYGPIGGVAGYQLACLRLLRAGNAAREGGGGTGAAGGEEPGRRNSSSTSSSSSSSPKTSLSSSPAALPGARISPPPGPDLLDEREAASARAAGLRFLPRTAEIVPLGGAGDRLGLSCDSTGEALPAALLPYAGRSLLEGIVRDLQAREYLHWRALGAGGGGGGGEDGGAKGTRPPATRVALMTSCAKGGDRRVKRLLERSRWFGRGASSFRVFCQPQVPLVAARDGRWLASGPGAVERRPGGHGALWKVLADGGAFEWLREGGATAAIVRQINNPLAGTDGTLLALAGEGAARGAAFGFACCPRRPGAAEGAVVLLELPEGREGEGSPSSPSSSSPPSPTTTATTTTTTTTAYVTCVEYTEFEAAGLGGAELEALPANSNLLFVDLAAAEAAVAEASSASSSSVSASSSPSAFSVGNSAEEDDVSLLASGALPGVVFNSSKAVEWREVSSSRSDAATAATKEKEKKPLFPNRKEPAGRLESTMQNLVDHMPAARARIDCSGRPAAAEEEWEEGHCAEEAFAGDASAAATASASSSSPSSSRTHLPTFALRGPRRRITSSAKRARKPGGPAAQTPEGSFLDLCRNAADLLARCGVSLPLPQRGLVAFPPSSGHSAGNSPPPSSSSALAAGDSVEAEEFLSGYPPFLFLFHPALGPTWDVISQKIKGGRLERGSELVLEVAEARAVDLRVRGSLLVSADSPLGHWTPKPSLSSPLSLEMESDRLVYSSRNGRARLEDVEVDNAGVEWGHPKNVPWRHLLHRKEAAKFRLRGRSELDARGVTLRGGLSFEVPDGKSLVLRPRPGGQGRSDVEATLEDLDSGGREKEFPRPSWEWRVSEREGRGEGGGDDALPGLDLTLVEN